MRILYITPRLPFPPIKGDRLRSFYFIKELSRGNTIHLLSFVESDSEKECIPVLKKYCEKVNVVYLSPYKSVLNMLSNISLKEPFQVAYYRSKKMSNLVKETIMENSYDLVHATLIRMAPYINDVANIPVILDQIDCLSLNMERRFKNEKSIFKKKLFEIEYRKMKKYESTFQNVPSIITSEKDKKALSGYERIKVISNGVDLEKFKCRSENSADKDIDFIFVGNMGYFPNIQAMEFFFKSVYPLLKMPIKNIKIYVVGANPVRNIRLLANNENIFVTGLVKDVKEYLYRAKVFIAPLQSGSGIQNKILEAMACGVPVVSTSIGNSGIKAKDKEELLIADTPEDFANKLLFLIDNELERQRIAANARRLVEKNFSWENRTAELQRFYEDIILY